MLGVVIVLAVQWTRQDKRDAKRFDRHEDAGLSDEFSAYNEMLRKLAERDGVATDGVVTDGAAETDGTAAKDSAAEADTADDAGPEAAANTAGSTAASSAAQEGTNEREQ